MLSRLLSPRGLNLPYLFLPIEPASIRSHLKHTHHAEAPGTLLSEIKIRARFALHLVAYCNTRQRQHWDHGRQAPLSGLSPSHPDCCSGSLLAHTSILPSGSIPDSPSPTPLHSALCSMLCTPSPGQPLSCTPRALLLSPQHTHTYASTVTAVHSGRGEAALPWSCALA